jgi:hypothetical protein
MSRLTMSPFFSCLVARHSVADLMVDRGADRLRIGPVAGWRVVERRGNATLNIDDVVVAERSSSPVVIPLSRGRDVVEHLGREAAGDAHFFDFLRGLVVMLMRWGSAARNEEERRIKEAACLGNLPDQRAIVAGDAEKGCPALPN